MGLNQYLHEKVSLNGYEYAKEQDPGMYARAEMALLASGITTTEQSSVGVTVTVMDWRKANQIHQWFVDHGRAIEPEVSYYVTREDLIELRDLCQKVLDGSTVKAGKVSVGQKMEAGEWVDMLEDGDVITNPEFAQELLPTTSGFFFGSTDYDHWYLKDLKRTVEGLTKVLDNQQMWTADSGNTWPETEFEYYASW